MSSVETARGLLEEHGVVLLSQPLRMEGFLKDLCPEEERDVFILMEALYCGFVELIRKQKMTQETKRQALAMDLMNKSGLTIVNACWAIDSWVEILPQWAYEETNERLFSGTLDDVLRAKHR